MWGQQLNEEWEVRELGERGRGGGFFENEAKVCCQAVASRKISSVNMSKGLPVERQTLLLSQETEAWVAKESRFLTSG